MRNINGMRVIYNMDSKQCNKCLLNKPISDFYKDRLGLRGQCKECCRLHRQQFYNDNKDWILERSKTYHQKHYPRRKDKQQEKARLKSKTPEARQKNNERLKARREKDPTYRAVINLRRRCLNALKGQYKHGTTIKLVGCSTDELQKHLESLWQEGMSWDNYGLHGWHIDHIKPLSSFNLTDKEEQQKAFHYTNLQPLWAEDNLKKGNSL